MSDIERIAASLDEPWVDHARTAHRACARRCVSCGQHPKKFPEDREVWLCRCDTTPEEWLSGHLILDVEVLACRLFDEDGRPKLRVAR